MSEPEKTELKSMDVAEDKRRQLAQMFPEVITEARTPDGKLTRAVDFEKLKTVLGTFSEILEHQKERYGMTWPGKNECLKIIQQPSIATLKPCREESVNFDTTENLFIEGDNLEVLKLLQKAYYGKVKMIYIDPPYNTGKEFIYPDKYAETLDTYLAYTGQVDAEGRKFNANTKAEGRFHSKWLNMMYPRMYLAANLLSDDGVCFVSIDDNELHNLLALLNEVFGEECFVVTLVWEKKKKGAFLAGDVTNIKEYVVGFAKNNVGFTGLIGEIARETETYPVIKTTNTRGTRIIRKGIPSKYKEKDHSLKAGTRISSGNMELILLSDLEIKDGILAEDVSIDSNWIYSQTLLDQYAASGELYVTQDLYFRRIVKEPRIKKLKDILPMEGFSGETGFRFVMSDNLFEDGWGTNEDGFDELHELYGAQNVMSFPKPSKLIAKLVLAAARNDKQCLVLDFFAGSGTTAHAVWELNDKDGGQRRTLLVQLPEVLDPTVDEQKNGSDYCDSISKPRTIAELTKERLRRAGQKIGKDNPMFSGDVGFRVYKLARSNFKVWDSEQAAKAPDAIARQLELHEQHIDPNAGQEDILYELLLKAGFPLTTKVEKVQMAGKDVFSVADGALLICLEREITKELIKAMADADPLQVICLDEGFKANDQLKANAVQTFKARSQGKDKEAGIVFRTV